MYPGLIKQSKKDILRRNLYGWSVRLDALCTFGNGEKANIEVQRADNDDHFRRVRFNETNSKAEHSYSGCVLPFIGSAFYI